MFKFILNVRDLSYWSLIMMDNISEIENKWFWDIVYGSLAHVRNQNTNFICIGITFSFALHRGWIHKSVDQGKYDSIRKSCCCYAVVCPELEYATSPAITQVPSESECRVIYRQTRSTSPEKLDRWQSFSLDTAHRETTHLIMTDIEHCWAFE